MHISSNHNKSNLRRDDQTNLGNVNTIRTLCKDSVLYMLYSVTFILILNQHNNVYRYENAHNYASVRMR